MLGAVRQAGETKEPSPSIGWTGRILNCNGLNCGAGKRTLAQTESADYNQTADRLRDHV